MWYAVDSPTWGSMRYNFNVLLMHYFRWLIQDYKDVYFDSPDTDMLQYIQCISLTCADMKRLLLMVLP